jgi:hypothetical protein
MCGFLSRLPPATKFNTGMAADDEDEENFTAGKISSHFLPGHRPSCPPLTE